jgi:ech hydrogenase subunit C
MKAFRRSPWVLHYDASSCNGCDIEVIAAMTPRYDMERMGMINTGNPKHADIFLVTGSVNAQNVRVIRTLYEQMPEPRAVVAVGICATSGCVFRRCYNVMGGVDTVLPVDVYVPGCAARPESIIDGIMQALDLLQRKHRLSKQMHVRIGEMVIERAVEADAPEILALQKIVYQNEAELYGDWSLSPLRQTLEELRRDITSRVFLKAVVSGKIIGSVRGWQEGDTAHVGRLIVHPYFWKHGIGTRLIQEIERAFPSARRLQTFMGQMSRHTMGPFERLGYTPYRREKVSELRERIHYQKERSEG